MNSKSMRFYKINLAFGIISFLIAISFRTEMIYSIIDDIHTASTVLEVWNWLILISLGIGTLQTLILAYKYGGILYALLSILVIVCLILTAIGMFVVPPGAILSMHGNPFTRYSQSFLKNKGAGLQYTSEFSGILKQATYPPY